VDGSEVQDIVEQQIPKVPSDASVIVLACSVGDGILASLALESATFASLGSKARSIRNEFQARYHAVLQSVLRLGKPVIICTSCRICFAIESWITSSYWTRMAQQIVTRSLNRVIRDAAAQHGLPLIDLARVMNQPTDYATPAIASAAGGHKITASILRELRMLDPSRPQQSRRHSSFFGGANRGLTSMKSQRRLRFQSTISGEHTADRAEMVAQTVPSWRQMAMHHYT
jgi:hypothetical protein